MRQIIMVSALAVAGAAGGCATVAGPTPAPSCDGGSRRPLNRSLWDWEAATASIAGPVVTAPSSKSAPPADVSDGSRGPLAVTSRSVAVAGGQGSGRFDVVASLRPCSEETYHG